VTNPEWIAVPYEVQVEIAWNDRPVTTLTTLRLATEPGSAVNEDTEAPEQ
jgi:hypothetical protein